MPDDHAASLAHLLCALSFATDLGMGQDIEHGLKSAYIGLRLADRLNLSDEDREALFYGALVKDTGCTACATVFSTFFAGDDLGPRTDCFTLDPGSARSALAWFWKHAPSDAGLPNRIAGLFSFVTACREVMTESVTAHCEVGELFAERLGLPAHVQLTVRYAWERWDGKGIAFGLKAEAIPAPARLLHLAQVVQVAARFGGRSAAVAIARERRGTAFDPAAVDAFLGLARDEEFWAPVEDDEAAPRILDARPPADFDALSVADVDVTCAVIADFADIKVRRLWNHSPRVAEVAAGIARALSLGAAQARTVHRAALVHDLGTAAIPVSILEKGEALTAAEQERFRLHPYFTSRVLARVQPLAGLADLAAAHHEWLNAQGYHRRLGAEQLPVEARLLAVADEYVRLVDGRSRRGVDDAVASIATSAGTRYDPDCVRALAASLSTSVALPRRRDGHSRTEALTEREIEVLALVSEGMSNRQVAERLVLSERTVERHMENILQRLDVTSRTAAVVRALSAGLFSS